MAIIGLLINYCVFIWTCKLVGNGRICVTDVVWWAGKAYSTKH